MFNPISKAIYPPQRPGPESGSGLRRGRTARSTTVMRGFPADCADPGSGAVPSSRTPKRRARRPKGGHHGAWPGRSRPRALRSPGRARPQASGSKGRAYLPGSSAGMHRQTGQRSIEIPHADGRADHHADEATGGDSVHVLPGRDLDDVHADHPALARQPADQGAHLRIDHAARFQPGEQRSHPRGLDALRDGAAGKARRRGVAGRFPDEVLRERRALGLG